MADTVAPVAVAATPTPLDAIDILSNEYAWGPDQDSALATVRDLVEAALAQDPPASAALASAAAAYRAWAPSPDAARDGGGE